MSDLAINVDRLLDLTELVCEESASDNEFAELDASLLGDPVSRCRYFNYCRIHVALRLQLRAHRATEKVHQQINIDLGVLTSSKPDVTKDETPSTIPVSFLSTALHGTIGYFSEGMPLAYLIATVVTGLGLLIGSIIHVSGSGQLAKNLSASPAVVEPKMEFIGQITGMVDCKWSDSATAVFDGAAIPLGRKYALDSGLVELTYDTGAKVILQGPVTYEVESRNGGFLAVGKLTGRVEVEKAKGFSVRTPTATLTDLGTEFGVEVDRSGESRTHVFRGKVELRLVGVGNEGARTIQLGEHESARVGIGRYRVLTVTRETSQPDKFSRQMPSLAPIKVFNTGVGLKEGDADSHWQVIAVSDVPDFKPQPAQVVPANSDWLANNPAGSQWVSLAGAVRDGVVYTFRTTFDLAGFRADTAVLRGRIMADNDVQAVRLNGRDVPVSPYQPDDPFYHFRTFSIATGFVEGENVLEIAVRNGAPETPLPHDSPMGLRMQFEGVVQKN